MQKVDLYSDGTYGSFDNIATWGFVIALNHKEIYREKGIVNDKDTLLGWQVGAELEAVIRGIEYCKKNNYTCDIYYDFNGVYNWVKDLFSNEKPWITKKIYTKKYREYIISNKKVINSYIWVKSHSGDFYNEQVDNFISNRSELSWSKIEYPKKH